MIEGVDGPAFLVLLFLIATATTVRALVSRLLGGIELGDILDLNHFTLPSG